MFFYVIYTKTEESMVLYVVVRNYQDLEVYIILLKERLIETQIIIDDDDDVERITFSGHHTLSYVKRSTIYECFQYFIHPILVMLGSSGGCKNAAKELYAAAKKLCCGDNE